MSPATRRVVQAVSYEFFAVLLVGPSLTLVFEEPLQSTLTLAVAMSTIAVIWNFVFNSLFERWEVRQTVKGRSLLRRLAHGTGFEGGLVLVLVPLMAFWLDTTLLRALLADLALLAFFFVYTVAFTWGFDRLFGLPQSAIAGGQD
jgi:uncharacterized membrane protein